MKKLSTSFFMRTAIAIALLFATTGTAAAWDFMYNGLAYNYDGDGTSVYVTYTSTNSDNYGGSLTNVVIPAKITLEGNVSYNVTGIGKQAFYYCSNLQSITIPASVKTIGSNAFYNTNIQKLTVSSVDAWMKTTLDSNIPTPHEMYVGSSLLTSVTIPSTVTTVGSHFSNVTSIKSVTIPNSVTEIGARAFNNCTSLATLNLGTSVQTIGQSAFLGCAALTSVTFPSSLKTLANGAFQNCTGLTALTIPENIETIDGYAFGGCTNIKTLTWNAINCNNKGDIPGENIEKVIIGNKVQCIPYNFVSQGSKIQSISIPHSVTSIGDYAFHNCSGLTSLTIPENLSTIGSNTFSGCNNIKELTWNAINLSTNGGIPTSNIEKVIIGSNVQTIPNSFVRYSKITSVLIPSSVTKIGEYAFANTDIVTARIPETVQYVGYGVYAYCTKMVKFFNATDLNYNYWIYNSGCKYAISKGNGSGFGYSLILDPNTSFEVEGITYEIFDITNRLVRIVDVDETKCAANIEIKQVRYHNVEFTPVLLGTAALAGNYTVKSFKFNRNVISIPKYAFYESALTKAEIPNSITSIDQHAFENCKRMTEFVVGTGVNTIDQYVLAGCSALRRVELGANVSQINANSFNGCNKIKTLRVRRSTPPTAASGVFNDIDKWTCTLYVPKGTVDTYKNAYEWKTFFFISDSETEPSEGDVNGDGKINVSDVSVLISMILGTTTMDEGAADVNGDGRVNVSDVSALINIILGIQ